VFLFGGCGNGGGGNSSTSTGGEPAAALVGRPAAKRPISAEVPGFERALESGSCKEFQPFIFSTIRGRPPGSPATRVECRREPLLAAQYARRIGPPISRARQFGTGALMEAPASHGNKEYTVWVLDGDGRFRFAEQEGVFHPEIGTPFTARIEAERVARSFVRAVDEHDCPALLKVLHEKSRFVEDKEGASASCRAVLDGVYFAPAIHATPELEIDALGGTRTFAFIVPTASAYFTLTLGQSPEEGIRVLDVLPNTPLEPAET